MRIRHLGLLNEYQAASSQIEGYDPVIDADSPSTILMTSNALMAWFWRVSSWRVHGALSWNGFDSSARPSGSGTFDLTLESDGPVFYIGQLVDVGPTIEKNLLHRTRFESTVVGFGTGDFDTFSFTLELGRGISKYNNGWKPTLLYSLFAGEIAIVNADEIIGTGIKSVSMESDGTIFFTYNNPTVGVTGSFHVEPNTYYAYANDDGTAPIYDTATGAQLLDPRQED